MTSHGPPVTAPTARSEKVTVSHSELANVVKTASNSICGTLSINGKRVGDLSYLTVLFNKLNVNTRSLNDIITLRWYTGDNLVFSLSFCYVNIRAVRMGQQITEAWTIVEMKDFSIKDGNLELLPEKVRVAMKHRRVDFTEKIRHLPAVFGEILAEDTVAA